MKTSKLKKIIYGIGISLFFSQGFLNIACSDWTDIEAKDYYEPPTQGYENNLKDYFNSPHKIMFGWFGNWAGKEVFHAICFMWITGQYGFCEPLALLGKSDG